MCKWHDKSYFTLFLRRITLCISVIVGPHFSSEFIFLFRNVGSKVNATNILTLGTSLGEMTDSQLDAIDEVGLVLLYKFT